MDTKFYTHLGGILPYNTYTLKKLVSRVVFPTRLKNLKDEIEKLCTDMKDRIATEVSIQGNVEKMKFTPVLRILFWNILCVEWEMAHVCFCLILD